MASVDSRTRTISELCIEGDRACTNGDLETLGDIAGHLAGYAHEPLHCELMGLAGMCRHDPDRAVVAWMRLKEQVLRGDGRPPP
ncbi:MAG TPA: hypothetical protein VK932_27675 [Kofleriaceae bacterium]|nr:hypothetical protein [Kofleriaceae bacterium]